MQKLRVTPIGTCRIHNPLRQASTKFPIALERAGIYGFTHTSGEALQMLRYLAGEKSFDERAKAVIFRPDRAEGADSAPAGWTPADLQIVEISSAKNISVGEDSVQVNYLYRQFADFFSSSARTQQYWSLVKRGDRAALRDFLRGEATYNILKTDDRVLLLNLRMEQQDFASIKSDMAEIVERTGRDAVLFVTHVDARTADGSFIPARKRVIQWVKLAAGQLDVPCFDPTAAMTDFGQERALERGGLDLTHFTPAFADRVYAEMHREHIGQLMESKPGLDRESEALGRQQMLADSIDALMRFDDFIVGTRRLHSALRTEPGAGPLLELRGKGLAHLGDFEGAIRDLEPLEQAASLSPEGRVALVEAYTATEQWQAALALAEILLGDEYENAAIYACAATSAERIGRIDAAIGFWKQAFRLDHSDLNAALHALTLLAQLGRSDQLDTWRDEVLENSVGGSDGAFDLARWSVDHRDDGMFAKVFLSLASADADSAERQLETALSVGMFEASAVGVRSLSENQVELPAATRARIAALAGEASADRLEKEDFASAYLLSNASVALKPNRAAKVTHRRAERHYRDRIREAYRAARFEDVITAWQDAGNALVQLGDAARLAAMSYHKLGQNEEALDLLLGMNARQPGDPVTLRWIGRTSALLGRFELAYPSYRELLDSADPAAERFRDEAERFFAGADRRALRLLRAMMVEGQLSEALTLIDAIRPHFTDTGRLQVEIDRVARLLRQRLRDVESGLAEEDERERTLALLLRLAPDDPAILRRMALEFMRQQRFEDAIAPWTRLNQLVPDTESTLRNLERCRVLAARQSKQRAGQSPAFAQ